MNAQAVVLLDEPDMQVTGVKAGGPAVTRIDLMGLPVPEVDWNEVEGEERRLAWQALREAQLRAGLWWAREPEFMEGENGPEFRGIVRCGPGPNWEVLDRVLIALR